MSQETFELFQSIQANELDTLLALQCAPVIMGEKIANLLIVNEDVKREMEEALFHSELQVYQICSCNHSFVFFIYHPTHFYSYITRLENMRFLKSLLYKNFKPDDVLNIFAKRYTKYRKGQADFPHELGIFLGYPVEDVLGFIENEGKNFLYSGYWKVYTKKERAIQTFQRYDNARNQLLKQLCEGKKIKEIIRYGNDWNKNFGGYHG